MRMRYLALIDGNSDEILKAVPVTQLTEEEAISIDALVSEYLPNGYELALVETIRHKEDQHG
jgi:hypothetical protein